MKPSTLIGLVAFGCMCLLAGCSAAPASKGSDDRRLPVPQSELERAYLGLTQEAPTFRLEEVDCDVLVIDCFDMYCHICQSGAEHVNELYRLVQERGLGNRVKFVGLGAGDTPLEVATYQKKFTVPFPVFPDRRTAVVRQFGEFKLPNLIVLRKLGNRLEVLHRSPGPLLDPRKILAHIQTDLGQARAHHWEDTVQATQPTCTAGSPACRAPVLSEAEIEGLSKCPALH